MIGSNEYNNDAIKATLSEDVTDALKDFLNHEDDEKSNYNYIAEIVDNKDPDKLGRCKVRVLGDFNDNVQDKDLPWALPDPSFVGSLKGSFIVPPNGCIVSIYYEKGEKYFPRYTRQVININKMPTNKDKDYPHNMIFFETDNGDKFEINRKRKETLFEHASGTKLFIDNKKVEIEHNNKSKIEINNQEVIVKHNSGAKIVIDAMGSISITPSPLGKVSLGNLAKIPCPDLPTCLVTGGPLAIGTVIPGSQVFIP